MPTPSFRLSQEHELDTVYPEKIDPYWQKHAQPASFTGVNGLNIHYVKVTAETPNQQAIVVSPGRTEAYLKYDELAYDLAQQGYDVFIIDHRGQGLSDRESARHQPGDVAQFQYYVDDLAQLIEQQVLSQTYSHRFILAHSMGGAIAAHYLQQHPGIFNAAALSAPMFGINLGLVPKLIATSLAATMSRLEHSLQRGPYYAVGQSNYKHCGFNNNHLTHSEARFKQMQQVYLSYPQIQLGGPTNRWLHQSFTAMQQIIEHAKSINLPLLLLQAEQDSIVTAAAQRAFFKAMTSSNDQGQFKIIAGSRHEILFERDTLRNPALNNILAFFAQHSN
ncbi:MULTISPECIES: alpha/beta fold hydrolase [unclassified Agarivorans]|uniref:alpha/beta fold hydrolase n=1 Tax=unclassified Agarivorans TaxID=2636026 RepID=UPI0026E229FC|nr:MULTISPECIES: alpha/beta fold hydrolase [unclassified Agarivorans]MDO6685482.1 alpha/beta fold hydrolase [Agarivorans sp. 3_MG-2023]MDO6715868.1 alpha/beta fold hydrolase [Agarivorans sp. 2_MG-2023]